MERAVMMVGIGGQGIQLVAKVLAQGAMRESKRVMMFGIFKGTIRGGSSESTVIVADEEIVTPPIVPTAWAVLAMHSEGLAALAKKLEPGGVLLVNASLVAHPPATDGVRRIAVPATAMAKEMGQVMGASLIALGAFAAATRIVSIDSLKAALDDVLPPHRRKLIETNRLCIDRGAAYAAQEHAGSTNAWA